MCSDWSPPQAWACATNHSASASLDVRSPPHAGCWCCHSDSSLFSHWHLVRSHFKHSVKLILSCVCVCGDLFSGDDPTFTGFIVMATAVKHISLKVTSWSRHLTPDLRLFADQSNKNVYLYIIYFRGPSRLDFVNLTANWKFNRIILCFVVTRGEH